MSDKFHNIRLQLTSEQLIELYTWLHDKRKAAASAGRVSFSEHPSEILHTTLLAHMLANLDSCKKPYVAVGEDLIIPMTESRLAKMAFGGDDCLPTTKSSPAEHLQNPGPYAQSGPTAFSDPTLDKAIDDFYESARDTLSEDVKWDETADLDEQQATAYLDELHKDN